MAITIEKVIPNPDKPHAPFVRLILDDGTAVEFTVRKAKYDTLTASGKRAYALECMEYHAPTARGQREARRAAWDADDKAVADAAAEAARLAQEAIFNHAATGFVKDKDGNKVGITATVTYHGLQWSGAVPYTADKAAFKASLEEVFAAYETAMNAEKAELLALA